MPSSLLRLIRRLPAFVASLALACTLPAFAQGFGPPTLVPTASPPVFVATADFNGDGNPDLLYVLYNDVVSPSAATTTVILLGDGKGGFAQSATLATTGTSVAIGHLSGSAHVDIGWLSSTPASNGFYVDWTVAEGNGDGTFGPQIQAGPGSAVDVPFPPSFTALRAADAQANSSILPAIVAIDSSNGYIFSFPIETSGLIATYTGLVHGAGPLTLADLNSDGIDDILVDGQIGFTAEVYLGSSPSSGTAFNASNAYFFSGTNGVYSLAVADFNKDGKPDLTVEGSSGRIDIFPGNGDGTVQSSSIGGTTSVDSTPPAMAASSSPLSTSTATAYPTS